MSLYSSKKNEYDPWDGELYRNTCSFVSEFGKDLIEWLDPVPGERILDVGCGTGELTSKLSNKGCEVVGLDSSGDMLGEAREKEPQPSYVHESITDYRSSSEFDAAISNAALHWITDPGDALESVYQNLTKGGRFVAEMGIEGNISKVRRALYEEVSRSGYEPEKLDPWYFPEPGDYISKLRNNGFKITDKTVFDRPTELYGEEGLKPWLIMFAEEFFRPMDDTERHEIIRSLVERLRDELKEDGRWVLGYRRLRFRAEK